MQNLLRPNHKHTIYLLDASSILDNQLSASDSEKTTTDRKEDTVKNQRVSTETETNHTKPLLSSTVTLKKKYSLISVSNRFIPEEQNATEIEEPTAHQICRVINKGELQPELLQHLQKINASKNEAATECNNDKQFYASMQSQSTTEQREQKDTGFSMEDEAIPRNEDAKKFQISKTRKLFENFTGDELQPGMLYRLQEVNGSNIGVQAKKKNDYICSVCGQCFKREKQFYGHLRSHSGEVRWRCKLCPESSDASFDTQSQLRQHENLEHCVVRPFQCPECNLVFDRISQRDYHQRSVHRKERSHLCPVCGKGFFRWSDMRTHLNIHMGNRWICEICGREFNHVSNLIRHSRTHAGVKPYPCSVCGKRFGQLNTLTRHKAIHTRGESTLKCFLCEKQYKGRKGLDAHMKIEHGFTQSTADRNKIIKRQHHCKICGESFQFLQLLRQHEEHHRSTEYLYCRSCGKNFWKVEDIKEHSCTKPKPYRKSKNVTRKSTALKNPDNSECNVNVALRIENNSNVKRIKKINTNKSVETLRKIKKQEIPTGQPDQEKTTKIQVEDLRSKENAIFVTIRQINKLESNKKTENESSDSLFWKEIPVFELSDVARNENRLGDENPRINSSKQTTFDLKNELMFSRPFETEISTEDSDSQLQRQTLLFQSKEATLDPKNELYFSHPSEMGNSKTPQNTDLQSQFQRATLADKTFNNLKNEKPANTKSSRAEHNLKKDSYSFQSSKVNRFTSEETQSFNEFTVSSELEQDLRNAAIFTGPTPEPTLQQVQKPQPEPTLQLIQRSTLLDKSFNCQNSEESLNSREADRSRKKDLYPFESFKDNRSTNEESQPEGEHYNEYNSSPELEQHMSNAAIFTDSTAVPTLQLVQRATLVLKSDAQLNEKKLNFSQEKRDLYSFQSAEDHSFPNEEAHPEREHFNEFNLENPTIFKAATPEPTLRLVQTENGQQFYELVMNSSPEKCETWTTNNREEHPLEPTLKLVQTENGQEFFDLVRSSSPEKPDGFPASQETQNQNLQNQNLPQDTPGEAQVRNFPVEALEEFSRTSFENDVLRDIHAQENGAEQFFELVQEIVRENDVERKQTERAPMLRLVQNEDGEQFFELVHGELELDVLQDDPNVAQSPQATKQLRRDSEDSGLLTGGTGVCFKLNEFAKSWSSLEKCDASRNRKSKIAAREFRCEVCGKVFAKRYNYQQHRGTHFADQQKFKCQECGTCFAWRSTLNKHMATHRTDARQKFVCEICPKVYSTLTQVNEHVKRDHLKERNHKCPHCVKRFFKKFDLKTHIRTHTKERPYVCRTCGKSFHHQSHIIRHERIHSGEKPYACDICQRTFTQHGSLKIHRQRHEKIKIDILDYQMDEDEPLALADL